MVLAGSICIRTRGESPNSPPLPAGGHVNERVEVWRSRCSEEVEDGSRATNVNIHTLRLYTFASNDLPPTDVTCFSSPPRSGMVAEFGG